MPTPYKQQVQEKLWALLETHAPFTSLIKAGDRLKQTGDGWLRQVIHRLPGEFPQVAITNGRFTHSGFVAHPPTYAMEQADFADAGGHWIVRRRCEYQVIVTGRDTQSTNIDPAEEAAQDALLRGGPRLGLAFVQQWGAITALQREASIQGAQRLQSVLVVPVLLEFDGHELVSA